MTKNCLAYSAQTKAKRLNPSDPILFGCFVGTPVAFPGLRMSERRAAFGSRQGAKLVVDHVPPTCLNGYHLLKKLTLG